LFNSNESFKAEVAEEYIDFFKNRKYIKEEIKQLSARNLAELKNIHHRIDALGTGSLERLDRGFR